MALSKKSRSRKLLLGMYLAHPIVSAKILLLVKKAKDIELIGIWHHCNEELKKRGIL